MRKTLTVLLASSLFLTACGFRDSRVNPLNWFGRAQSAPIAQETGPVNPLIPKSSGLFANSRKDQDYAGRPFEQVTDLTIERVPGGAIVRATGLAARQGIYAVQLTPANKDEQPVDGVLTYRIEGVRPTRATPAGAQPTREVIAGRRLTDQDLRGVRSIRVEGQLNALVARR
jgi:major membrane immunogen (membrane-anchored lipoprotein)